MNFEGELVISPYAQYCLWKISLCPFRHRPAEVSTLKQALEKTEIVFLAFTSNRTLDSVAFKIF